MKKTIVLVRMEGSSDWNIPRVINLITDFLNNNEKNLVLVHENIKSITIKTLDTDTGEISEIKI